MQLMGIMLHGDRPSKGWECLKRFERGVLWDLKINTVF
jgi:hypothetical protein